MIYPLLITIAVLAAAALPAGAAPGTEPPPTTPAGKRLAEWIDAFNSGDRNTLSRFIQDTFSEASLADRPLDARLDSLRNMHASTLGVAFVRAETSSPESLQALVRTKGTEEYLRLGMTVEPDPPHRIVRVTVQPVPTPADLRSAAPTSDKRLTQDLDAWLSRPTERDLFSGTVLVARDGKVVFRKAYGKASRAWNAPNRPDTRFNLGSMNKMITAVAIAQLVEQGKLSFEETVGKVIPDYPNKDVAAKVTIHQLLTHTSGMGSYFNDTFMQASRERFRTVKDFEPLYVNEPLAFEPGARWEYSNSGFMLLGAIVEKVSGKDYFTYVRDHITGPAGMVDTECYDVDRDIPNLATGYTRMGPDGDIRTNTFMHVIRGGPAGGGYSTVDDLLRFDQALRSGKILGRPMVEKLFTGHAETGDGGRYGYGMMVQTVEGQRIVGHGGGFPGLNSQLDMYLDSGATVAVMSNLDPPAAQRVALRLQEWLLPSANTSKGK